MKLESSGLYGEKTSLDQLVVVASRLSIIPTHKGRKRFNCNHQSVSRGMVIVLALNLN